MANRFGGELFSWHFFSQNGESVTSSSGIPVAVENSIEQVNEFPTMFVCASFEPEAGLDKALLNWLRRLDRQGTVLGELKPAVMPWPMRACWMSTGWRCTGKRGRRLKKVFPG